MRKCPVVLGNRYIVCDELGPGCCASLFNESVGRERGDVSGLRVSIRDMDDKNLESLIGLFRLKNTCLARGAVISVFEDELKSRREKNN